MGSKNKAYVYMKGTVILAEITAFDFKEYFSMLPIFFLYLAALPTYICSVS